MQRGAIVNCASVNSLQSMAGTGAYTASKHGCHGITKTVRIRFQKRYYSQVVAHNCID
jgi:NAD(P)-dependent dehydrogenase (short-subunit alcohol dehydrogenase family)